MAIYITQGRYTSAAKDAKKAFKSAGALSESFKPPGR